VEVFGTVHRASTSAALRYTAGHCAVARPSPAASLSVSVSRGPCTLLPMRHPLALSSTIQQLLCTHAAALDIATTQSRSNRGVDFTPSCESDFER
jgi:hypothetical protein